MNINVNSHSSIQIDNLFFDPFEIKFNKNKAKYIILTHTHYDHFSLEDIDKLYMAETIFIAPRDAKSKLQEAYPNNEKYFLLPGDEFVCENFKLTAFSAYNLNKEFHKKEYNWLGYKLEKDGETYIICGDTDATEELLNQKCDVLFVPIGGTYTMTAEEAAELTNKIKPKIVVPTHYGSIVGDKSCEYKFLNLVDKSIQVKTFNICK